MIYLDNNATTPPWPEVVETVRRHLADSFANPGSRHAAGRRARRVLEDSREAIAAILGADPKEVVFTSGGTESITTALLGSKRPSEPEASATVFKTVADASGSDPSRRILLLTQGEHPATLAACRALEQQRGWTRTYLPVDGEGRLIPEAWDELPWSDVRLVTVILAHNETGVIQDLAPLAARCQERGVPFHVDAVQAVGKIPVNFHELQATALSLGAHKFHGPRGIGALLIKDGTPLTPMLQGGHQERERRAGTEPVALIAGMATALKLWHDDQARRTAHVQELRDQLQAGLEQRCPPALLNGSIDHRLPNTLNVSFPGTDGEALLVALDLEGIACSLGSTCASGSMEPAPALVAMGLGPDRYQSAVRFSLGVQTTETEITEAIARIARVVHRLRDS